MGRFLRASSGPSAQDYLKLNQGVGIESRDSALGRDNTLSKHLETKGNMTFLGKGSSQWLDHRSNGGTGCFRLS